MREPLARFSGFPVVACAHSPSFDALRSGFWCGLGSELPTRRPLLPLNAGTAEPFRVSPPEAVAYPLELFGKGQMC